ncbi:PRKC apoptosis WT1 regulator protein [Tachysurus fulvidraco]|uniref:PRKC apoptosis WT1 regulator protein n=1 Tax=Tachysurus fulvidraco TaxID=1234273 RepID=UPI001FEF52BB|nr:PRKC apoptosis WT1 regulator protein [Tachysurus fulvidraco]XP_047659748.1 PRKC apoptosis WT1 regulator protein [Tachysurus fulvidraco]
MASGGFKSNAATDFLEEWKAKREKMRAKMLGDIAAITSANVITTGTSSTKAPETRSVPDLNSSNGNPERSGSVPLTVSRSASSSALTRRADEEPYVYTAPAQASTPVARGSDSKKSTEKLPEPGSASLCPDSDLESPKGKEKKSSGPSARKGKGQIEKRKLREKRRSTGVVSIPSNESLDELDDDDGDKEGKNEEELTQQNTVQNESMASDPGAGHTQDTTRSGAGRYKSEEDVGGNRHRQTPARHGNPGLERRIEELEKELALERQENARLLKSHQDKDELIVKLKEEVDLLNRDLDDIEDENEQLKQENKTLLKVVGQLTR